MNTDSQWVGRLVIKIIVFSEYGFHRCDRLLQYALILIALINDSRMWEECFQFDSITTTIGFSPITSSEGRTVRIILIELSSINELSLAFSKMFIVLYKWRMALTLYMKWINNLPWKSFCQFGRYKEFVWQDSCKRTGQIFIDETDNVVIHSY
jgi:hypothetical protein